MEWIRNALLWWFRPAPPAPSSPVDIKPVETETETASNTRETRQTVAETSSTEITPAVEQEDDSPQETIPKLTAKPNDIKYGRLYVYK